jgi:5-methylcytosine-specific restriction endonuclease McrA
MELVHMDSIPEKQCTKCGEKKPATTEYFYFEKRRQRLQACCIACSRIEGKERIRKWRAEHPEEAREKGKIEQRLYRQRNPEKYHDRQLKGAQRRLRENPEQVRAHGRAKYLKQMQNNPQALRDKGIRNNHVRRERAAGNTTTQHFTTADAKLHFKTQKGKCWWCGKKLDPNNYTIDHRIAISRGGSNAANNICISCPHCNFTKNDKLPSEWNGRLL